MIWRILIVVFLVLLAVFLFLYFYGNKLQARQAEQQALLEQMKQTVSILTIDKKKMKLSESGLPQQAIDQSPWYAKRMKVNVVKAKIQNRIMVLLADEVPFEQLVPKKEAKVVISGIYITQVLSIRGESLKQPAPKKGFKAWISKLAGRG